MKTHAIGILVLLVGTAALLAVATPAQAESPWPVLQGHHGGYYILVSPQLYPRERLPHFALYPPVYYSVPVPRTYGYSPFAYPPGYPTPEVVCTPPTPVTIYNPFVPKSQTANPADSKVAQKPLRIANPFVTTVPQGEGLAGK
ncbi:MAG: hypothetical protein NUV77_16185 [Thermoguttaceae bacterium]|jgi:hypothetical protein|nr:hypothetical protein [Thermoguttaceae bacterium]